MPMSDLLNFVPPAENICFINTLTGQFICYNRMEVPEWLYVATVVSVYGGKPRVAPNMLVVEYRPVR